MRTVKRRNRNKVKHNKPAIESDKIIKYYCYRAQHAIRHHFVSVHSEHRVKNHRSDNGKNKVHRYTRKGNNNFSFLEVVVITRIYRNRFCPAEPKQNQQNEAYRVNVRKRIERHSSQISCRGVSHFVCRICMTEFMKSQRNQNCRHDIQCISQKACNVFQHV